MGFLVRISILVLVLWFIPWVWSFYFGFIVYFPYKPDNESRYVRITGPLLGLLDDGVWATSKEIPSACKDALVAAEDTRFYQHYGVDLESIELALEKNEKAGKKKWGASTITQQLVKNAFLSRKRSYVRKAREMVGAVLLDAIMTKEQQLVWYFNVVEFGPLTYGLTDAAKFYFKKTPAKLTTRECVLLVSLLPSPNRSGRHLKAQTISRTMERRSAHILRALSHNQD